MKTTFLKTALSIFIASLLFSSCKKQVSGVCYCHYLNGTKTEYNFSSYARSQQIDSCYLLDKNAAAFAGDCDLK